MPTFEVTSPDGRKFRVTAPEGATQDQILAYVQQQTAAPATPLQQAREQYAGPDGAMGGLRRAIENGLTFGFRDELGAALDATVGGVVPGAAETWRQRYDAALASERGAERQFRQEHPVMDLAGNIAGGVLTPLPGLTPAARGANWGEQFLRSSFGRGAAAGAVGGGVTGFGEGEGGFADRLATAGKGAALGSVAGGAIGAGVNVAGRVIGRGLDLLGLRNSQTAADRHVLRALERDSIDPAMLARQPLSSETTLTDLGGRNTVNLAATAANTPGAAMEAADVFIQGRRAARPDRIASAVDDALGGGGGTRVADDVAALQQRRATEAGPRYQSAFGHIVPTEDEVTRVLPGVTDRIGQDALQRGLRVIELEHVAARLRDPNAPAFNPADYGVMRGEDGRFIVQNGYRNLRLLDAVKRGYDEIVEGFRDPTSGRLQLDQYGRAVNDARAAYVGQLRDMYPRYGAALDAWAGPTRSMDAVARGRQALRTDRDIVDRVVSDLSPADREFFRIGVGRAITDATADPGRAVNVARRLVEDRQMQARLQTIIPDPAQRARFASALQREVEMAAVERAVSPRANSHTRRLEAGAEDMAIDPPGGMLAALLMGRVGEAARQGMGAFYRRTQGINSSTADALAERLLRTDQASNTATIARLLQQQGTDQRIARWRADMLARALRGVGVGISPDEAQ